MDSKQGERVIVLVDMDCFYVQVEQKLCPEFQGKPCAVVQYNTWKGGGIIAVNYEARAKGVKRGARGEEAQKVCPDIHLFRVPEVRGKADLTRYREAGASVLSVLCDFCDCVERASIDEAYLELTSVINARLNTSTPVASNQIPNTFISGWEDPNNENEAVSRWLHLIYEEDHLYKDRALALAAVIVEEMRAAVYNKTGYRCSAGIAHNKMLAKLSCGLHKPNKQTVLPEASIPILYENIPINKVRSLGGKFGAQVAEKFNVQTMADLLRIPKMEFYKNFGEKSGFWLYNLSRGIESEPVTPRQLPKSIGCGKNFPGKSCLDTKEKVMHWVKQLSTELEERLLKDQETNHRFARLLTLNIRNQTSAGFSMVSKSCQIHVYNADKIAQDALSALQKFNSSSSASDSWTPAILSLAMAASKFEDRIENGVCNIQSYFQSSKTACDQNESNITANSSHIDTVIDLLDSESTILEGDKAQETEANKTQKKNLSDYFTTRHNQVPTPSTVHAENKPIAVSSHEELFKIQCHTLALNKALDDSAIPLIDNSNFKVSNNVPVKGFFVRKLEERLKLNEAIAKNCTNDSNPKSTGCDSSYPLTSASVSKQPVTVKEFFNAGLQSNHAGVVDKANPAISETAASKSTNAVNSNSRSIQNFFNSAASSKYTNLNIASDQAGPSTIFNESTSPDMDWSNLDPELLKLCQKCNKNIPIWEEDEHNDYHFALDISKELAKEKIVTKKADIPNNGIKEALKNSKGGRKRGTHSKPTIKSKKPVQKNTLDSFIK